MSVNDDAILAELCQPTWPSLGPAIERNEFDLRGAVKRLLRREHKSHMEQSVLTALAIQCNINPATGLDLT